MIYCLYNKKLGSPCNDDGALCSVMQREERGKEGGGRRGRRRGGAEERWKKKTITDLNSSVLKDLKQFRGFRTTFVRWPRTDKPNSGSREGLREATVGESETRGGSLATSHLLRLLLTTFQVMMDRPDLIILVLIASIKRRSLPDYHLAVSIGCCQNSSSRAGLDDFWG